MEQKLILENDIRPAHAFSEYASCYEADLFWMSGHRDEFQKCSCPACLSGKCELLFVKDGFRYNVCTGCSTEYISPRPCARHLTEFYAISKVYQLFLSKIFPASEQMRRNELFKPRLDRVKETCAKFGLVCPSLLEVGTGFGLFCHEAEQSGYFSRVVGVEPNGELAAKCRSRGLTVYCSMIENIHNEDIGSVDVICTYEVIEHILEPHRFLQACRGILNSGGLLVFTCPNSNGFDLKTLGIHSDTYNFQHLNYFNPTSVRIMLEINGFELLQVRTPGKLDVDLVRKSALRGQIDLRHESFLRRVLLEEYETLGYPFQQFLADNLLSGHMEVIAKVS